MASEYLNMRYPDVKGFSPRSLRRMRDFYRTYENHPVILRYALKLGWTQNVVIMEAELTTEQREWNIRAVLQFGWSKAELFANIYIKAHESMVLNVSGPMDYNENVAINRINRNVVTVILRYGIKRLLGPNKNFSGHVGRRRCYL